MNFVQGQKVYVHLNPHVTSSYIEVLTVQKQSGDLLYFEEKDVYYAVECKKKFFYGYSHNTAGNVLVVEKLWHLPFAKTIESCRFIAYFLGKKESKHSFSSVLNKDSSFTF